MFVYILKNLTNFFCTLNNSYLYKLAICFIHDLDWEFVT